MTRGQQPATPFQMAFARAGHGHAGVLVVLALVTQLYADVAELSRSAELAFRASFEGPVPPVSQLYWRALTLERFDGPPLTDGAAGIH